MCHLAIVAATIKSERAATHPCLTQGQTSTSPDQTSARRLKKRLCQAYATVLTPPGRPFLPDLMWMLATSSPHLYATQSVVARLEPEWAKPTYSWESGSKGEPRTSSGCIE